MVTTGTSRFCTDFKICFPEVLLQAWSVLRLMMALQSGENTISCYSSATGNSKKVPWPSRLPEDGEGLENTGGLRGVLDFGLVACMVQNSWKKTRCTAPDFRRNTWLWVVPRQRGFPPWDMQSAPSSLVAGNNPVASGELNKVNTAGSQWGGCTQIGNGLCLPVVLVPLTECCTSIN